MRRQAISGIILAIFALVLLAFNAKTTLATTPLPHEDYTKASPNNAYLLVVFVPKYTPDYLTKIHQELRDKYKVSGLYRNDGSTDPLWTIDLWDYPDYLFLSSDGKHLVHLTAGFSSSRNDNLGNDALYFYENGNVIKSYKFSDLIKDPANLPEFPVNTPLWSYGWLTNYHFDDARNKFDLTTRFGEKYRFDTTNGKIDNPLLFFDYLTRPPWPYFVLIGLLLAFITGLIIDYRKGKLG